MGVARAKMKFGILVNAFLEDNFLDLYTSHAKRTIPRDAEILNGGYDEDSCMFFVDFEHPDFEDFEEFEVEPDLYYIGELASQDF